MNYNFKNCKNLLECIKYLEENIRYKVCVGGECIGEIDRSTIYDVITYYYPDSYVDSYNIVGFADTRKFFQDYPAVLYKKEREIYLLAIGSDNYVDLFEYEYIEDNYDIFTYAELAKMEE